MANNGNRPVQKFQAGGVQAALWKNAKKVNGSDVETLSVSIDRRYKDKSGAWQSTRSLHANDVPKAVLVLLKAYDFMTSKQSDETPLIEEEIVE